MRPAVLASIEQAFKATEASCIDAREGEYRSAGRTALKEIKGGAIPTFGTGKDAKGRRGSILLLVAAGILAPGVAPAHEKWFVSAERHPLEIGAALADPLTWLAIGAPVLFWVLITLLWRWRRRPFVPGPRELGGRPEARQAIYAFIPLILAVHLGVPLLVSGLMQTLFTPANQLAGVWAHLGTLGQIGVALGLFYGTPTRLWAVVLALMWVAGFFVAGAEPMLEAAHILGFAAFFFCAGRGPFAVDRAIFPRWEPPPALVRLAVPLLRVGIGLSLIVVACTEKLLNVPLALAFLKEHPVNFSPALGIPVTDVQFILAAGAMELFIGLCVLSGVFLRDVIVVAWLPFNLTLGIFGPLELVGHLPFYGAMALFFVWEAADSQNFQAWERGILRPSLGALLAAERK